MVISGGPKKKTDRGQLGIQQGAPIKGSDREFVVLVLAGGKGEINVNIGRIVLQSESSQKFLLSFRELFLAQQGLSQATMQFGVLGLGCDQSAICVFREIIFSGTRIKVSNFALRVGVRGGEFQRSLDFRDGVVLLPLRGQYAPQLEMNASVIGALGGELAQQGLSVA